MIIGPRLFIVFLTSIVPLAMAFNVFSGGTDHTAVSRGALPMEQPAPVGPAGNTLDRPSSVGVQEVSRPDGGHDVIYYSVTPPEEKQAQQQAENKKKEKSLELLDRVIIIPR
jgi:hypothetical protein